MDSNSWRITVVTPGKMYRGSVSTSGTYDRRTLTLLNANARSIKYTANPNTSLDGFLILQNASLKGGVVEEEHDFLSIRKSEIIFAYDEFETMGSDLERKRFQQGKTFVESQYVALMTIARAGTWYRLTGHIYQLAQRMSGKETFIPMTGVKIQKVTAKGNVRGISRAQVPFVAVNRRFVESVSFTPPVNKEHQEREKRISKDTGEQVSQTEKENATAAASLPSGWSRK